MSDEAGQRRWPAWVYGVGDDPDPRFSLANERTFLAWIRTGLAFVTAGLGISALAIFELVAEATRAYLCNFNSMTDGNGTEMEIADAIEEITSRAEFEFHRVTGIDHITGSRDSKLKRKHLQ